MAYETLNVTHDGGLATILLNRPERLNAMSAAMIRELPEAMEEAISEPAVRAILVTGAGRGFCAGADLQEMNAGPRPGARRLPPPGEDLRSRINPMLLAMVSAPKPIIAAVNGPAVGVGCSLALAADIVIAARSASFIQAFVKIGAAPDGGSSWLLPRLVGRGRASAMMLLGEAISAEQALDWGMVHQVTPDEDLAPRAIAMAQRMASGPTLAMAATKRLIDAGATNDLAAQLELEAEAQDAAFATEDCREAVAAFAERRPPCFKGA